MALTPRSFLKSPALLVAAIVSAGIALLGAAVFIGAFMCTERSTKCQRTVENVDRLAPLRSPACDHVLRANGDNLAAWSESDWVRLSVCFENGEDPGRAATTAAWGIGFYPESETLHNIRGYNLIVQEEYRDAVIALRVALQSVEPTTGTLQNNLAWAGLFASEHMTLSEARKHYQDSLAVESSSCEALHTGMWTEYGIASRSSGSSRDAAIAAYGTLRSKYEPCVSRAEYGDRMTRYEVAGAAIMDAEISKLRMIESLEKPNFREVIEEMEHAEVEMDVVKRSLRPIGLDHSDIDEACEDIAPVRSALPACRKAVSAAVTR